MKKFLVFLTSIVVVVCFGLTTYYFMRNDEIITINTKELYCNAGDIISLDALDITIKKPYRKTQFNYNASTEEVASMFAYNQEGKFYQVSENACGEVELIITTTNKKYAEFKIKVHIGNGSIENPYYIFNEIDLNKIGSIYRLDSCYSLMNDIALTNEFSPIGYSEASSSYVGFSGKFFGNGYTISGLNLTKADYSNAGLFSSINAGAEVKELTLNNAVINGSYENAGVLAGSIAGNVEKVAILNSSITNLRSNSFTGALAGVFNGSSLKISYANNVTLNIGSNVELVDEVVEDEESEENEETTPIVTISDVTVGGLVGKLEKTTAIATYVNNANINLTNATGVVGGYAGEFVISTNMGSIQQSYANSTCADANFAGFIGKITTDENFNASESNMLTHFIGNIAVINKADIEDKDIVKTYNENYFKNQINASEGVFFNPVASLYLIRGFASAGSVIETNEYVYYAIDANNKTLWDTTYVWNVSTTSLPSLTMGSVEPNGVSGEYFRKDLTQVEISENTKGFKQTFSSDVTNANIKLLEDVNLTSGWTPVNVSNSTIDGNNKTITVNLSKAANNKLGIFSTIDNCTIKNLNIVVVGVNANATNVGALAGIITSSTDAVSTIENVNITFADGFGAISATNFGGVAGTISNTNVVNSSVNGLNVNSSANIENAGSVVGSLESGSINNVTVDGAVYASNNAGGVAGINKSTISKVTANVSVNYNKVVNNANVGGVAGTNNGTIVDTVATVKVAVSNASAVLNVGGVAGTNNGTINNTTVNGDGVAIGTSQVKVNGEIYVGGIAAINAGTITSTYNHMNTVGTYYIGASYRVGGVAAVNKGNISKVLTSSDIYGNFSAGLVVEMKETCVVDQVVIGKYNTENKKVTANTIVGDKYVAGVVVDFRAGTISNIQASSNLEGKASSTRTSLIALVFTRGATFTESTINSTLSGYGAFYRETWVDCDYCDDKSVFGIATVSGSSYFDIYESSAYCGDMTSVVINGNYANNVSVNESMGSVQNILLIPADDAYNGTNCVKVVSNFNDYNQFVGSFTFNYAYNKLYNNYRTATQELTFDIGTVWQNNNGIGLIFLNNIQ